MFYRFTILPFSLIKNIGEELSCLLVSPHLKTLICQKGRLASGTVKIEAKEREEEVSLAAGEV